MKTSLLKNLISSIISYAEGFKSVNLTILLILYFMPFFGFSQSTPISDVDTVELSPAAVPLVQIPEYGQTTRQAISNTKNLIAQNDKLEEIQNGVSDVLTVLEKKVNLLSDSSSTYQLDYLEREDRELDLLNQRISQWKTTIQGIQYDGASLQSDIDKMSASWKLTLESLNTTNKIQSINSDSLSQNIELNRENVKAEVQIFIDNLNKVKRDLNNFSILVNNIQTQLTVAENKLGVATNIIATRKKDFQNKIWSQDSPFIWQAKSDSLSISSKEKFVDNFQSNWNITAVFIKNNPKLPYSIFVLFGFILGAILYIKPKIASLYKDYQDELTEAKIIFANSVISSLIILWFISSFFTFFPKEFNDLVSLFMIIPLVVLLSKLNPEWRWYTVVLFAFSCFLFLIISSIDFKFLDQRILLLFFDLAAFLIFYYFKKQKNHVQKLNSYWLGILPSVINIFLWISIGALVANIIGSVQFALLLTMVTLGTILAIFALQAAVIIVKDFIFLILMGPLIKYSYILQEDGKLILRKLDKLMKILGLFSFVLFVLNLLNISKAFFDALFSIINYQLKVGEINISLGNILAFFLTIQISIWLSSFIRYVLEKEVYPRGHFKPGIPNTISLMIRFTFTLLGILLAFSAAGIQIDKLAIAMGALGVGIGFGLQNIVYNFVSGVILALERPIKIGDFIEIPDASGIVKDIGLRASTVRTWEGSDVIVPNGDLTSNRLKNWTYYDHLRRINVDIRVPFNTDIEALSNLLLKTAKEIPEVLKKPLPFINFQGIGTSAMEINLYCWIADANKGFSSGTAIRKAVYKALQSEGYDIPIPKQDLNLLPVNELKPIPPNKKQE